MEDPRHFGELLGRAWRLGAKHGFAAAAARVSVRLGDRRAPAPGSYETWLNREPRGLRSAQRTLISVLVPVHDPDPEHLDALVTQLRAQTHTRWEALLVDDGSRRPAVARRLAQLAATEARVRTWRRPSAGGISKATNEAAARARGDVIVLLDHDDLPGTDLLAHLDAAFADDRTDLVYTDEDQLTPWGARTEPRFKPGCSAWLALGFNYVTHPMALRRSFFRELGGLRSSFDGSQDHDLLLRALERARRVRHLPVIGYHWRRTPRSVASSSTAKPWAFEAGRRAVDAAARRRGLPLERVEAGAVPGVNRLVLRAPPRAHAVHVVLHGPSEGLDDWERVLQRVRPRWQVLGVHRNRWPSASTRGPLLLLDASLQASSLSLDVLARWAGLPGVGAVGGSGGTRRRRHLGWSLERSGVASPVCPGLRGPALGPSLLAAAPREVAALANGVLWLAGLPTRLRDDFAGRPVDTSSVLLASAAAALAGRACLFHPELSPAERAGRTWQEKRVHLHGAPGADWLLRGLPEEFWAGDADRYCPRHELLVPLGMPAPGEPHAKATPRASLARGLQASALSASSSNSTV
ncbi:MAG: hypothetical protein DHS20C15_16360 [Planctomycetota bacterium]|nr:MAG: hypothetical protein DHS20C15_16360 [Planctomycetota bacterium]